MKERGMAKVQEVIEEGLMALRDELGRMERDVEQLGGLLYECDVFLQAEGVLGYSLNPREALSHVSGLFASYQAELIRLRSVHRVEPFAARAGADTAGFVTSREVLADFTCEEIGVEEFVEEWRVMKEVSQAAEQELDGTSPSQAAAFAT